MKLTELWKLYEADKRIQGFSPNTLKAYALQLKMMVRELGEIDISEVKLQLLKEYLAKQSDRLKPSSLGHRIRFIRKRQTLHTFKNSNLRERMRAAKSNRRLPYDH